MSVWLRRWTREEYERLVEVGVLGEDDHVQLIEGEIVEMTPQNAPHMVAVHLVADALRSTFGPGFSIRVQGPLALGIDSEPEPDVAVVRGSFRDYRDRHPTTAVLVVEVADSTWRFDRERKSRAYARAGIHEYWIVNLETRTLEVYRDPAGDRYGTERVLQPEEEVSPVARPDARIRVADLLP